MPNATEHRLGPLCALLLPEGLGSRIAGEWTGDEPLDGVQFTEEGADLSTGGWPLHRDLVVFPLRARQTMGERDARSIARQHFVDREAVDHHGAAVVPQDLAGFIAGFPGRIR
jgi:hypothetical protein